MDLAPVLTSVAIAIAAALLLVSLAGERLIGVAMAIGAFVAYGLLKQWPESPTELWRHPNGSQWLVWCLVGAGLWSALEPMRLVPAVVKLLLGPLFAAGAACLVLQKVATHWAFADVLLYGGGGAIAAAVLVVACRAVIVRGPLGINPAVLFTVMLSVDAAVVVQGGDAVGGQLCGAVAATLGAACGTRLWRQPFVLGPEHANWIGLAHGLFLLAGVHLAYLSWPAAGCAFVAPLLPLLLGKRFEKRPTLWLTLASVLVLLPLGAAVWLATAAVSDRGW